MQSSHDLTRICAHLIPLLSMIACDGGVNQASGPELVIDPVELRIALPSGGDYSEGVIRLSNLGGANVIINSLTLTEDDNTQELTLVEAEDWSGRIIIEPEVTREVRVGWRVLDAQADTGSLKIVAARSVPCTATSRRA